MFISDREKQHVELSKVIKSFCIDPVKSKGVSVLPAAHSCVGSTDLTC